MLRYAMVYDWHEDMNREKRGLGDCLILQNCLIFGLCMVKRTASPSSKCQNPYSESHNVDMMAGREATIRKYTAVYVMTTYDLMALIQSSDRSQGWPRSGTIPL